MSYDPATSIRVLLGGGTLGRSDTEALFGALMDGALDEVQKTAMLVALAVRGETPRRSRVRRLRCGRECCRSPTTSTTLSTPVAPVVTAAVPSTSRPPRRWWRRPVARGSPNTATARFEPVGERRRARRFGR